jgi:glycosyltransferase involved in cell wall biosynthesis
VRRVEISVIVPFFNAELYIEECAKALVSQTLPAEDYEIIFVDNGSLDRSRQIAAKYPGIRILEEPRRGAYAARNRGVAASAGRILAFTDPDCVPALDWLGTMHKRMEDPLVAVLLGSVASGTGRVLAMLDAYSDERARYIFSSRIPELYLGYTNNLATRRSTFEQTGPFVEVARGSDMLFVRRVVQLQSPQAVVYAPEAFVRHLEVDDPWVWLRKMFLYGQTSGHYRSLFPARTLNPAEQFEVFRQTARRHGYAIGSCAVLFAMLVLGVLLFRIGRWSRLVPKRK